MLQPTPSDTGSVDAGVDGGTQHPPVDHAPASASTRAPGGMASLDQPQAGLPSFRDVNPIGVNALFFKHLRLDAKLPDDVPGCVAYMLSSMRPTDSADDIAQLKNLASQQAAVLERRGITTRDQFIALLEKVQWRDRGTAVLHGMAGANGFNVGSALVDFKLAEKTIEGLMAAVSKETPAALPALAAGAMLGLMLSVLDAGSGAAAEKTFADAYFTRPPQDKLPAPLQGANPHTKASLATDLTVAAGISYGGLRNGLLRVPQVAITGTQGTSEQRAEGDGVIDVVGGSVIGGGGMRAIRNSREIGDGRAGFQHFLARTDLDDCLAHLEKSSGEQVLSALAHVPRYGANVVTTLPQALKDVLASRVGWTSHAILTTGFAGLFSMLVGMPEALKLKAQAKLVEEQGRPATPAELGKIKMNSELYTQLAKFAGLQLLYHVWGGALGAVAGPRAPADPSPV
jgi:hypothetical protein